MSTFKMFALGALALVAAGAATSCTDDNSNPAVTAAQARVMAVHASPDAPGVDLLVDGGVAGTGLAFPNNTAYLNVASGTRNVKVNVTGSNTTVIEANVPAEDRSAPGN